MPLVRIHIHDAMSNSTESRFRRLAKEGGWILIGQVATVAGSLVLVRVLTGYLSPTEFGQLALGLTVAGLVNQVVMGGIGVSISRFYSIATEKEDLDGYLHASYRLMIYATGVVLLIGGMLLAGLWFLGYKQWLVLAAATLILSVLGGYNGALSGVQNAARQRANVAFHGGLEAWLKIGLAVAVMVWLGHSSTSVVIGYAFSSLLITISQIVFLRRTLARQNKIQNIDHQWMQKLWLYSMPLTTWGAFTWMQQASDRWALQIYASSTEVGQYAVLFQLGYTPIAIVTGLVVSFFGPILFQQSGDATDPVRNANVHRHIWKMTQLALVVTALGFMLTFALHEWLFGLLVTQQYRESSYLLPWVVLAGGLFAAGQTLSLKLMSEMKTAAMARAKITTALCGIVFNAMGAALGGIQGVVGASIAFSAFYVVWMALLAKNLSTKA
jgi:O-antigen/teichoic acid export membrane protein